MGYDAGTADGTLGAKTTAAVKKFQADIGVAQTGKINQTLLTQIYSSNRTPTTGNAATGTIATGSLGGLPQSFVSQLSTNQIQRIRAAITTALTSQFETDGPFPFSLDKGLPTQITGRVRVSGSPNTQCRPWGLDLTLANGSQGSSASTQQSCRSGTGWSNV